MAGIEQRQFAWEIPLTPSVFARIVQQQVHSVEFTTMEGKGYVVPFPSGGEIKKFQILISTSYSEETQKRTFVHEVNHINRGVGVSNVGEAGEIENELTDREAQRFYEANKDLVSDFFLRVKGTDQLDFGL